VHSNSPDEPQVQAQPASAPASASPHVMPAWQGAHCAQPLVGAGEPQLVQS
jgi:hypothetical protein